MRRVYHELMLIPRWRRALGAVVAGSMVMAFVGATTALAFQEPSGKAATVLEADRIVRTNLWLEARGLDTQSSADMKEALILACEELEERGERC